MKSRRGAGRATGPGPARAATGARVAHPAVSAEPRPVLIVDDDLSVRRALRRLFRSAGYPVETFASAAEFLAYECPPRVGCVVLDIRMPGISGLDLQQQLAATRPDLPIVVITGHADEETRQRALDAGAIAVLYKPFDDEMLLEAVARAVERSRP